MSPNALHFVPFFTLNNIVTDYWSMPHLCYYFSYFLWTTTSKKMQSMPWIRSWLWHWMPKAPRDVWKLCKCKDLALSVDIFLYAWNLFFFACLPINFMQELPYAFTLAYFNNYYILWSFNNKYIFPCYFAVWEKKGEQWKTEILFLVWRWTRELYTFILYLFFQLDFSIFL